MLARVWQKTLVASVRTSSVTVTTPYLGNRWPRPPQPSSRTAFGPCRAAQSKAPAAAAIGSLRLTNRQGQLSGVVQGREGADTGRASRINVSQADGVAAIRIDIAAGSVYLRSCPSGTQSTSAPPLDFSEMGIIPPGLKRMLGASHAIRSGGQPCSPRARRSRHGPARS